MMKCYSTGLAKSANFCVLCLVVLALGVASAARALTLTGVTIYGATDSRGTFNGAYDYWDTRGGNQGFNVYLFMGSTNAPDFLNSGDSNDSLDPDLQLAPGTNTVQFAVDYQDSDPSTPYLGINLYFNGNLATNRISAVVPNGGLGDFSVVSDKTTTYGEYGKTPGAGTLSYTKGDLTVTLSAFCISQDTPKLVSGTDASPGPDSNFIGSFTLTVTRTGAK